MPIRAFLSPRADALIPDLLLRLQESSEDPFRRDLVVVPSAVFRDWLSEQLAQSLRCPDGSPGVLANVEFLLPGEFYERVEGTLQQDSQKFRSGDLLTVAGHLFVLISKQPSLVPSIGSGRDRMSIALRLSNLFERYAIDRPDMLTAWADGKITDGLNPLPARHEWQFQLWRMLQERLVSHVLLTNTKRNNAYREDHRAPFLFHERITIFGLEVLSSRAVRALKVLVDREDIALYGTLPSEDVHLSGEPPAQVLRQREVLRRDEFADFLEPKHPLLRTWASSAYETAALLMSITSEISYVPAQHVPSLLGVFQDDLANGRNLDEFPPADSSTDGSIQIHRCHGAIRQVEVARDAVLHILDADPTLTLRDVVIVAPDIDRFAPLIQPIFGIPLSSQEQSSRTHHLSTALLDGNSVETSGASQIVLGILSLIESRCTRSEVKAFFSIDAVRKALNLDDEALLKIDRWLEQMDVRWGLSERHRERAGYPSEFKQGSWTWAADRLVAGAFVQAPEPVEFSPSVSPYDDVGSGDTDTLVHLVSLIFTLEEVQMFSEVPRSLSEWATLLRRLTNWLIPSDEEFLEDLDDAREVLTQIQELSDVIGDEQLSAREVRSLLASQFQSRHKPVRRWADVIRVGTLGRLRGIPSRVVIILGLDDGALAGGSRDGDDILAESPRIGERDRRADDRLALLATVGAAKEHLIVTADGFSVTSNAEVAPSIPQTELVDAIRSTIGSRSFNDGVLDRPLVVSHSRQLSNPVNLGVEVDRELPTVMDFHVKPWTFDSSAVVLAGASRRQIVGRGEFAKIDLPPLTAGEKSQDLLIGDLVETLRRPLRVLLRDRLGVVFREADEAPEEDLMLWPNALEKAVIGREWMSLMLKGLEQDEIVRRFDLSGRLPMGNLGQSLALEIQQELVDMTQLIGDLSFSKRELEIDVLLDDQRVRGRVSLSNEGLLFIDYARHHPSRLAEPWITLAATVCQLGGEDILARVVTRSNSKDKDESSSVLTSMRIAGESPAERAAFAEQILRFVKDLRDSALCRVIPMFDRATWSSALGAKQGDVKNDLERDCEKPEYKWTRYLPTLKELMDGTSNAVGENVSTAQESEFVDHSRRLAECFSLTTVIEREVVEEEA